MILLWQLVLKLLSMETSLRRLGTQDAGEVRNRAWPTVRHAIVILAVATTVHAIVSRILPALDVHFDLRDRKLSIYG